MTAAAPRPRPPQPPRRPARLGALLALALALAACAATPLRLGPGAAPPAYVLLPEALARGAGQASVAGAMAVDTSGARLVDALLAGPGGASPASAPAEQLWLELDSAALPADALRPGGDIRTAIVVASGRLEGPGAYGPGGAYRFRMQGALLTFLSPQEVRLADLLARPDAYAGRAVRVTGGVVARPGAALLVERIGPGGVPAPGAVQAKLAPLRDAMLPDALGRSPSGSVRFGDAQVEGLWRGGALAPLTIVAVTP